MQGKMFPKLKNGEHRWQHVSVYKLAINFCLKSTKGANAKGLKQIKCLNYSKHLLWWLEKGMFMPSLHENEENSLVLSVQYEIICFG